MSVLRETPEACPGCEAPLAVEQRHCIACGLRVVPDELRLAALPSFAPAPALGAPSLPLGVSRPVLRSAAVTGVVVLALGIGIGATIGPAAVSETAAAQPPVVVLAAAPAAAPALGSVSLSPPSDGLDALDDTGSSDASTPEQPASDEPAADTPDEPAPTTSDPPADGDPDPAPAAPPAGSVQLAGIVVQVGATGEGFAIALRDGTLREIHASGCGVELGDDLHLRAHPLANGTWAADRVRRVRAGVSAVRVDGVVSYADPTGTRYAIGARGVSLLVGVASPQAPAADTSAEGATSATAGVAPTTATAAAAGVVSTTATVVTTAAAAGGTTTATTTAANASTATDPTTSASTPAGLPVAGQRVGVRIALSPATEREPAKLIEVVRHILAPGATDPVPPLELEGTLASVDTQARTIVLALDDAASATVTLTAPETIDLTRLLPAERLSVSAVLTPGGSYALTGLAPDGDALAGDDASTFQGDQALPTTTSRHGDDPVATAGCSLLT